MSSERGAILQTDSLPPAHVCIYGNTLQLTSSFPCYSTKYAQHTLLSKYVPPLFVPFCLPVLQCPPGVFPNRGAVYLPMYHMNCPAAYELPCTAPLSQFSMTWFEFLWWAQYKNTPSLSITKQPAWFLNSWYLLFEAPWVVLQHATAI